MRVAAASLSLRAPVPRGLGAQACVFLLRLPCGAGAEDDGACGEE